MQAPLNCPAGTFGTEFGKATMNDACKPCPANSFSAAAGATKCTPCGANQWTNRRTGQQACWSTAKKVP